MGSRPIATEPDIFWTRVDVRTPDECWNWKMSIKPSGYGQTWDGTRNLLTHRVAYTLAIGPIPDGLTVDHLCRNRRCVNPRHLEAVTNAENIRRAGAAKTHCPQGHEYTPANTYVSPKGERRCRRCGLDRTAAKKAEARRAAKAGRTCAGCGAPLPVEMKATAKWCSSTCRAKTNWREHKEKTH